MAINAKFAYLITTLYRYLSSQVNTRTIADVLFEISPGSLRRIVLLKIRNFLNRLERGFKHRMGNKPAR